VRGFVESEAGTNLLAAHRRAVNILPRLRHRL
jgi:hypothetical protein